MKKTILLNFIFFACCFDLICQTLDANINLTERGSSPSFLQSDGKTIVFTAQSQAHGNELFYIEDGTDAKLLFDATLGEGNTHFYNVNLIGESVYYVTEKDQILFYWKKDLDNSTPKLLNEIRPSVLATNFSGNFIKVNDKVVYTASTVGGYTDVYETDGVSSVKIHQLPFNFYLENLIYLNGRYFCFEPNRIYTFDVQNSIMEFENANFSKDFAIFNNKFYFSKNDAQTGYEIWEFDGVSAPKLFKDLAVGPNSTFPFKYHVGNGKFYFFVYDPTLGLALYESDGTVDGTKILLDASSDPLLNMAGEIISTENGVYYTVGKNNVFDLYYKESSKPYQLVKSNVGNITWVKSGSNIYFQLYDANYGYELWKANANSVTPDLVKDIYLGENSSDIDRLIALKDKTYFSAKTNLEGNELWVTDGTEVGTKKFANLNQLENSSSPYEFTVVDDNLYFSADDGVHGFELWKYNASEDKPKLVKDILKFESSYPLALLPFKDRVVFKAYYAKIPFEKFGIFITNEAGNDVELLKDTNSFYTPTIANSYTVYKDRLYFGELDMIHGVELWSSDGTKSGTNFLKDISIAGSSYPTFYPNAILPKDNTLLFSAFNDINGTQLWKTDGTADGTTLVADINKKIANPNFIYNEIGEICILNNDQLILSADDGVFGQELWITNGTKEGTKMVKDIYQGSASSNISNMHVRNGIAYFIAKDDNGYQLWRSNGTFDGTYSLTQFSFISYINSVQFLNNQIFFTRIENNENESLWISDGTIEGTKMVKDFYLSGINSVYNFNAHSNKMYFAANDFVNGQELWESDGTESGTKMVADINPGSASSAPFYMKSFNGDLYFNADDGTHGNELWKLSTNGVIDVPNSIIAANIIVYPNPTTNHITIQSKDNEIISMNLIDNQGIRIASSDGSSFDFSKYNSGVYYLEIESKKGKLVKKIIVAK